MILVDGKSEAFNLVSLSEEEKQQAIKNAQADFAPAHDAIVRSIDVLERVNDQILGVSETPSTIQKGRLAKAFIDTLEHVSQTSNVPSNTAFEMFLERINAPELPADKNTTDQLQQIFNEQLEPAMRAAAQVSQRHIFSTNFLFYKYQSNDEAKAYNVDNITQNNLIFAMADHVKPDMSMSFDDALDEQVRKRGPMLNGMTAVFKDEGLALDAPTLMRQTSHSRADIMGSSQMVYMPYVSGVMPVDPQAQSRILNVFDTRNDALKFQFGFIETKAQDPNFPHTRTNAVYMIDQRVLSALERFGGDGLRENILKEFHTLASIADHDYLHSSIFPLRPLEEGPQPSPALLMPKEQMQKYNAFFDPMDFRIEELSLVLHRQALDKMFESTPDAKEAIARRATGFYQDLATLKDRMEKDSPSEAKAVTEYLALHANHRLFRIMSMEDPVLDVAHDSNQGMSLKHAMQGVIGEEDFFTPERLASSQYDTQLHSTAMRALITMLDEKPSSIHYDGVQNVYATMVREKRISDAPEHNEQQITPVEKLKDALRAEYILIIANNIKQNAAGDDAAKIHQAFVESAKYPELGLADEGAKARVVKIISNIPKPTEDWTLVKSHSIIPGGDLIGIRGFPEEPVIPGLAEYVYKNIKQHGITNVDFELERLAKLVTFSMQTDTAGRILPLSGLDRARAEILMEDFGLTAFATRTNTINFKGNQTPPAHIVAAYVEEQKQYFPHMGYADDLVASSHQKANDMTDSRRSEKSNVSRALQEATRVCKALRATLEPESAALGDDQNMLQALKRASRLVAVARVPSERGAKQDFSQSQIVSDLPALAERLKDTLQTANLTGATNVAKCLETAVAEFQRYVHAKPSDVHAKRSDILPTPKIPSSSSQAR